MSQNFTIKQGETLAYPFFWYSGDLVTKAITAIALTFPAVVTAVGHGILVDQVVPVRLETIRGTKKLNTPAGETVYAKRLTADTVQIIGANASGMAAYIGGGYLTYTPPTNLTGYTARMQLRESVDSEDVLLELTSPTELVLDATAGMITVSMTEAETAALTFDTAVYDLELVSSGGISKRLAAGKVTVSKEVTRAA